MGPLNSKNPIPHQHLLDELQLLMLTIVHQLPVVSSMLKWAKATVDGKPIPGPMGWMMIVDPEWTNQDQINHLVALRQSVSELKKPLHQIMTHIQEFTHIKPIERAIFALHRAYKELPIIEPEMELLKLGHNIFENKELIPNLVEYTEKVSKLQEKGSHLKQTVVHEIINRLSIPTNPIKEMRFSDLEERIDESS